MKTPVACMLCAIIALADTRVLAQRGTTRGEDAEQNGWRFSLDEARAQARQSGMPLMVVIRCVP